MEEDIQAKEQASKLYMSQSQEVAGNMGIPITQIREYASLVSGDGQGLFGERYWSFEMAPIKKLVEMQSNRSKSII